jgi:hypothetical protein
MGAAFVVQRGSHVSAPTAVPNLPWFPRPVASDATSPVPSSKRQQPARPVSFPRSRLDLKAAMSAADRATFQMRTSSITPPNGKPAWVNRGSGAFNDGSRVFYGVGVVSGIRNVALARSSADTRARAEVGTALNTFISALMRDSQSSISDIQRSEEQQMVEQTIRQFTDVNLSGVRITDHWQDPSNGTLYALAHWDIEQASQSLEQMNQLNARTRDYIRANAERAFDRLDAARNEARPPTRP